MTINAVTLAREVLATGRLVADREGRRLMERLLWEIEDRDAAVKLLAEHWDDEHIEPHYESLLFHARQQRDRQMLAAILTTA